MKKLRPYLSFLMQNLFIVLLSIAFNGLSGLFRSIGAVYLRRITDGLGTPGETAILTLILVGALLTFASYALRWLGAITPRYLGEKFALVTRLRLMERLQKIPFALFESKSVGDMQSIIRNDSVLAGEWIYAMLSRVLNNIFLFVFSVWVMAGTNWEATISIILFVFVSTFLNQLILKRMSPHYAASRKAVGNMTHSLEKTFGSLETVKTHGCKEYVVDGFMKHAAEACGREQKAVQVNTLRVAFFTLVSKLCLYAPMLYLGFMGISGQLSIGNVVMFVYLVREIITPIEVVFRWMSSMARYLTALERTEGVLRLPEEGRKETVSVGALTKVEADKLSFAYDDGRIIFSGLSFCLARGEITRLAGDSGSGKTTLMKVLLGLYDSPSAHYLLDGRPSPGLAGQIAYSSLDRSIFPFSVYENMTLGESSVSREDCMAMLDRLGFCGWIQTLPQGIDTKILPDQLSGGQRQAIAVGRGLLSKMPILLLDEPFSALDPEKYERFLGELSRCKEKKIILLTSHREDTDARWGQVIRLRERIPSSAPNERS